MEYKNNDFVLKAQDASAETEAIVYKYDAFLEAITSEKFAHVREAIREGVRFLVSGKYPTIDTLAREHYEGSVKMKAKYNSVDAYLAKFPMHARKSATIDLATGTGKSWVIYGIAQIMLAEGLADKVLVLCPSVTIEEGLKEKFRELSGNANVSQILQELDPSHTPPEIKSANDPILSGDICVENIHSVYERTGSSIRDSFAGKGKRTLVISDEAHHIFSPEDAGTKRWFDFLTDEDFDFVYHIGLTGTPYIQNGYFHDVIFRYGLKQAMEDGIVKTIDYVLERALEGAETQYEETYANHVRLIEKYSGVLKPITIVITAKIVECIEEWRKLVDYIAEKERISFDAAKEKVIWVTSGLPSGAQEKKRAVVALELTDNSGAEKIRKKYLQALKSVDDEDNPVEYIVSVAMLTEGWDVKNVFQIVPHSNRAFDSKLLISQVLGRGLRIPKRLTPPVQVVVNNHEQWTTAIGGLYRDVLEIENRITWGYDPRRAKYAFPLFNLEYEEEQYSIESKVKSAKEPSIQVLHPQAETRRQTTTFLHAGIIRYDVTVDGNVSVEDATRQIKLFLKEKDRNLARKWSIKKIDQFIKKTLKNRLGRVYDYVSAENLATFKQAFGPMFRELGKEVPRMKLMAGASKKIEASSMSRQSFSEDALKTSGTLFYPPQFLESLSGTEKMIIEKYISMRLQITPALVLPETQYIMDRFYPKNEEEFVTSQSAIYVTSSPEIEFVKSVFNDVTFFAGFIKSPDKGFYSIPYSFKPTAAGSTHVKRSSFNPDFFLVKKGTKDVLVVEIKQDDDLAQENKAKYRDACEHFTQLNQELVTAGEEWRYHFYFLSPTDYASFLDVTREGKYIGWKSELMQGLE
ncbi:MAG: DEAD/DEAH box helicase family protein [bacterium]|nr:DEAD/DEAH box helicase family protein [bacterium]